MRHIVALLTAVAASLALAVPAQGITFGQVDTTNRFSNVGAAVFESEPGTKDILCSGTLIAPRVFLTAGHCTAYLESQGIDDIWVTFDPSFDAASPLIHGTYYTHPLFGSGGRSNTYDLAVVVLDAPATGITPASLPTAGQLDRMDLKRQRFTAVGYGTIRDDKTNGPHSLIPPDGWRRYADQGFRSLTNAWLNLSMNPSTGSGGTCYGDSGGPHFLAGTNTVVSVTVTGDRFCRATDVTYRLDTPYARSFLDDFVTLP
jgi:secreted trypsin-like serine protease